MTGLLDRLQSSGNLSETEWEQLIANCSPQLSAEACRRALIVRRKNYGTKVFLRGLIEISSFCKNNCFYCGIRVKNSIAERYRLTDRQILDCCADGYRSGFRTFVLQGGEDPGFDDGRITRLVQKIKQVHPDCAVTLSLGERPFEIYREWREAGADRYLLRHESASPNLYARLHPDSQQFSTRMKCLESLRELQYQVGAGFMVGAPFQTPADLAKDLLFLGRFKPEMVGIGPFISHRDTPFANFPNGSAELTVFLLALIRLMLPDVLLPATTALATLDPEGRLKGLNAGANVIMPNLSPESVREKYSLYDHKAFTGLESASAVEELSNFLHQHGFHAVVERGDHLSIKSNERRSENDL